MTRHAVEGGGTERRTSDRVSVYSSHGNHSQTFPLDQGLNGSALTGCR